MTLSDNTFVRKTEHRVKRYKLLGNMQYDAYDVAELVTIGRSMIHRTGEVIGFKELKSKVMIGLFMHELETQRKAYKQHFKIIDYFIDFEI